MIDQTEVGDEMDGDVNGIYSDEELQEKLDILMEAKKIEKDTKLMTAVKEFARGKHQALGEMVSQGENKAPKKPMSLDDLRKKANAMK